MERLTLARVRDRRYRVDDDAWETVLRRRLATLTSFRDIARAGMDLIGASEPRARRMRAARDSFDWLAAAVADAPQRRSSK